MEITPQRKLYVEDERVIGDLRIKDGVRLDIVPANVSVLTRDQSTHRIDGGQKMESQRHPMITRSEPFKSMGGGSSPSCLPLSRRSAGNANPCRSNVNRVLPRTPSLSTRSLSINGLSRRKRKRDWDMSNLLKTENNGARKRARPSRREDIFRALAKIKVLEASKAAENSSASTKNEG